jgi:hypothetical protein
MADAGLREVLLPRALTRRRRAGVPLATPPNGGRGSSRGPAAARTTRRRQAGIAGRPRDRRAGLLAGFGVDRRWIGDDGVIDTRVASLLLAGNGPVF